jgi:signal transduction histidine kinase
MNRKLALKLLVIGLGMGVGLSLSRVIAEDHGGTLNLIKDKTDTCFRLVLPISHNQKDINLMPPLTEVDH